MKMWMLLLVSSAALLVNSATVSPRHTQATWHYLYDLAEKYHECTQGFLEDVSHLAEGTDPCGDKFFCKVQNILSKSSCEGTRLVRTLHMYNKDRNCKKILEGVTTADPMIGVSTFMNSVKKCVQHRNFWG